MMFSKSYCPFCKKAKDTLKNANIEFKAIEMDNMDDGISIHGALKAYSK